MFLASDSPTRAGLTLYWAMQPKRNEIVHHVKRWVGYYCASSWSLDRVLQLPGMFCDEACVGAELVSTRLVLWWSSSLVLGLSV